MQTPCCSREVASPRVGYHYCSRNIAGFFPHLLGYLHTEALNPRHSEACIEPGIEKTGLFQQFEKGEKELRPHTELHDFRAVGLALTGLLDDLRLSDALRVVAFLPHDAVQSPHCSLTGHGGPVVAAGGGDNPGESVLPGMIHRDRRPAGLETAGGIGRLILDEDPRSLSRGCVLPREPCEVP